MKKLLVLGVGNILMQDEGFGVHAINAFWEEKEDWKDADVDFIDGGTFTQDIFYLFEAYENVLVLDIVRANQPPGTIFTREEHQLRKDKKQMLSLHDIDLLDSLGMAQMRGHRPYLRVVGIEPAIIDWGTQLTPPLAAAFPDYLKIVRQQIIKLLGASDKD
ncbi:NiFeSe hydrogenase maturation protease [uncultured Desulfobacter sp.]|uniref:NiFeSe hydrogenase maturation protease n=1 Tax=uncultured Desulfobacter sp. TaxID=240139 RepID=UPI002AAA672D|nr:NiFeSe hydrogenase maturation protease [uncultured Desulfobacter sp.]